MLRELVKNVRYQFVLIIINIVNILLEFFCTFRMNWAFLPKRLKYRWWWLISIIVVFFPLVRCRHPLIIIQIVEKSMFQ